MANKSDETLTYYELLGVKRDAPYSELVRAFKQKSLATHPTRNPNDLTVNTIKFREICEAFDVLSKGNNRHTASLLFQLSCARSMTNMESTASRKES